MAEQCITELEREYDVLPVDPAGIPDYLQVRPQWVMWRLEKRNGKPTKVPYDALTGERASTTELMTWSNFEEAYEAYKAGAYAGVGFVF